MGTGRKNLNFSSTIFHRNCNYVCEKLFPNIRIHPCIVITSHDQLQSQAVADPGQGWINCILYIFLSPELRKRMFVQPFQRLWRRLIKNTVQRQQGELETQPLLGNTTDALSVPASGTTTDKRTHTYLSFPTEFP